MCEHHYLIYWIVDHTDLRLFNRYRRPLGLDYKPAQRMAICQSLSPLRTHVAHMAISRRFGRRPGLQSKWRTFFAGTSNQKLPTAALSRAPKHPQVLGHYSRTLPALRLCQRSQSRNLPEDIQGKSHLIVHN